MDCGHIRYKELIYYVELDKTPIGANCEDVLNQMLVEKHISKEETPSDNYGQRTTTVPIL